MPDKPRILHDYIALRAICEELDWQHTIGNGKFRVGHYDDKRKEIQFYSVLGSTIGELKDELDKAKIDNEKGLLAKYEFYTSHILDNTYLVLVRPRLIN